MRRVCITAAYAITPRGPLSIDGFSQPPKALHRISRFSVEDFPIKVAGEVKASSQVSLGLETLTSALPEPSRLLSHYEAPKIGVFVGAEPERVSLEDLSRVTDSLPLMPGSYHKRAPTQLTDAVVDWTKARGARGTFSMACAASASAIASAFRSIQSQESDAALCIGAALNVEPLLFAGFCLLRAMSASGQCRPFDQNRDGFVLSDGAGTILLEAEEIVARQGRQREILGYLEGAGESLDAYRITDPSPEGSGAEAAINAALLSAKRDAKEISLVKAHATGTFQNDIVEAKVLSRLFAHSPPVLALKGGIGHSIAACGVVELIAALASLRLGQAEEVFGLLAPDVSAPALNIVPWAIAGPHQRDFVGRVALCNTFGFGGINCALIVSAP